MWIPAPVYEALPPIYGVAGIVAIGYSLNGINVMPGLLLMACCSSPPFCPYGGTVANLKNT